MKSGIEARLMEILRALPSVKVAYAPKFAPAPVNLVVAGVAFK